MNTVPMPPTCLPAFGPVVNGDLWRQWENDGRVFPLQPFRSGVRYVRFKPNVSCRIAVFRPGPESDPPEGFLLHLFPDAERARTAYAKTANRPIFTTAAGYAPFLDETHAVVAMPYPNDGEIPALRHFHRSYRLRKALAEVLPEYPEDDWRIVKRHVHTSLLAYKPGRRAVYRVDLVLEHRTGLESVQVALHVKVDGSADSAGGVARLDAIHRATPPGASWRVPAPRGRVAIRRLSVTEWVDGERLDRTYPHGGQDCELHATGRALAEFHRLEIDLEPCRHGLDATALHELADDLGDLLPDHAHRIVDLGNRLVKRTAFLHDGDSATLHGDFHLGQVLIDRSGWPVLVDLDRAGRGHPVADVGAFLAHLEELSADRRASDVFLDGYHEASDRPIQREAIRAATAAALFRRSIFPFRGLSPSWPEEILGRLRRAERLLEANP